jgi:hypothetical protein
MSAVELENSLYALGGQNARDLDAVQKLSLDRLTWMLMELKLPQTDYSIHCFKTDTQVYLLIKETLYNFTPLEVKPIKTLESVTRVTTAEALSTTQIGHVWGLSCRRVNLAAAIYGVF